MKAKKLLAMLMAATMLFSTTNVMAASSSQTPSSSTGEVSTAVNGSYSTTIFDDSTVEVPVIKVTVPTKIDLKLNPYEIGGKGPIESKDMIIKSESNVPLSVGMSVKATVDSKTSGLVFATAKVADTVTTKSVFAYAEIAKATTADSGSTFSVTYAQEYNAKTASQIVIGTRETAKTAMHIIDAAEFDSDGTTCETPTYAAYTIKGNVATNPTTAWAGTDVADITIVFTFVPQVASGN